MDSEINVLMNARKWIHMYSSNYNRLLTYFYIIIIASGFIIYKVSVCDVLKYIFFQIFYILLPGLFIWRILVLKGNLLEKFTISYGFGIATVILQYLIFNVSNFRNGLYFVGPFLSLNEIYFLLNENKSLKQCLFTPKGGCVYKNIFHTYFLLFIITFFGFTLSNPLPSIHGTTTYNQDLLWFIGNIEALMREFPPVDPRVSGSILEYHYFPSIYLATLNIVMGLNPVSSYFNFYQIGNLLFLVLATFTMSSKVFNCNNKAIAFTYIFFFTNCASLFFVLKNGYGCFLNVNFTHLTDNPFGYEFSISFIFLCTYLLMKQIECKSFNLKLYVSMMLFFLIAAGSKGPNGLVFLLALFILLFYELIRKNVNKIIVLNTLGIFIIFCILYVLLFAKSGSTFSFFPGYTVTESIIGWIFRYLLSNELTIKLLCIISIPIHFFLFMPFAAFPFLKQSFGKIRCRKNIPSQDIFIGSIAYIGIVFGYLLYFPGDSQIYFLMISVPFIELFAIDYICTNYSNLSKLSKLFIIFTFLIGICTTLFAGLYQGENGILKINDVITENKLETQPNWNSITKYEYEGMIWLSENTDPKDIIASDRYYLSPNFKWSSTSSRYFYYSTFSQRQFFLEGWEYRYSDQEGEINPVIKPKIDVCKQLYSNDPNKAATMAKNNINYLIISRFVNPNLEVRDKNLCLVFSNRDIKIYTINDIERFIE